MAHYALIDEDNIVQHVITGVDEDVTQIDESGDEVGGSTEAWETFYANLPWFSGLYAKRTSYNNKIRKQFAGRGYRYDVGADVFVAPQPFDSWTLDDNFDWQPPKPYPNDGRLYRWNEDELDWQAHDDEALA